MLNEFKLFSAVNESVTNHTLYENSNDIAPHEFTGLDCVEAMQEASYVIMSEAAAYEEFSIAADELMVEAVMTNPVAVDALSESILTNIGKGVKRVFDKLISVVKGIIEKIKAFFAKFTGQTDKWLKIMEPKINAVSSSDVKYMMYNWDEKFILDGIKAGIGKLKDDWKANYGSAKYTQLVEQAKRAAGGKQMANKEVDADNIMKSGELNKELENIDEKMLGYIKAAIGTDGTTAQEAINASIKKAHGGDSEKSEIEVFPKKAQYIAFVRGSKKAITDLQNHYKDTLAELNNYKKAIDQSANISFEHEGDMKGGNAGAVRSALKTNIDYYVKFTTRFVNTMNTLGNINIGAIRDCAKEYMGALSKLAGTKEKKDKDK